MWLLKDSHALLTDLYELTMAQAYFANDMHDTAYFEVAVRSLPENWGFFVMAGLAELETCLQRFQFTEQDIEFLKSLNLFSEEFLNYLGRLKLQVEVRALPEGTVFFPNEPILEVGGPIIHAQILETCVLNILGFSIIEAALGARIYIAARALPVVDFGLRRAQGPVAAARAARAAQIAGFVATSNLSAARLLNFTASGTMAHSYVEVHETEEQAFLRFGELYGEKAILLVDTYEPVEGIKEAADVARRMHEAAGVRIAGIRIDSGDFVSLSRFARQHFREKGVEFLKIFVSSGLDEFRIADMLAAGAEVDGFGVGTRFTVSHNAPDIDIVYKIVQYADKGLFKTSPDKHSRPQRKTVLRTGEKLYAKDTVLTFSARPDDLLKPFTASEPVDEIKKRLSTELAHLPDEIKAIRCPQKYPVEFAF
jgi:nicotinate phosphoribosyltransferase